MLSVLPYVRTRSTRGLYARVDPAAIAHNLAQLRATFTGQTAPRIWATVKADAYGHGIERVLPGLLGADGLAVLHLGEAESCRTAGWRGPVLVYGDCLQPLKRGDWISQGCTWPSPITPSWIGWHKRVQHSILPRYGYALPVTCTT